METINNLITQVKTNALYVGSFLLIIAGLFVCSVVAERIIRSKKGITDKTSAARRAASVGLLSAISAALMLIELPMPFAPSFYKLDLSELPVMIGAYAFGPSVGVLIEFIKIILKLFMKGTSTAFVGELANFAVGASFVIPAATLYYAGRTKKNAIKSCVLGTICITMFGTAFNAVYLLPAFAKLYGMPLESILDLGAKVNPLAGNNIVTFVLACVAPLNLIKGAVISLLTLLVYKRISPVLKGAGIGADLVTRKNEKAEEN
ncbi:MAG: ECF transporter S component [Lachnospiraceae bacterium]|nr:ECF transporter S component [Lachnospiraceae bacterium]